MNASPKQGEGVYSVGRTIRTSNEFPDGVPCVLIDGDSVFCEFPSSRGMLDAQRVCDLLNAPKHGDDAGDDLRYVLCQVGFGDHYKDWLLIPHVDGGYVTAAKLVPFSMAILMHQLSDKLPPGKRPGDGHMERFMWEQYGMKGTPGTGRFV